MRLMFLKSRTLKNILNVFVTLMMVATGCKDDDDQPQRYALEDIDGNVYDAISIGAQIWMTDNLRVTKFNDGTLLTYANPDDDLMNLTSGSMSYYDDNPANASTYGALYNWHAVGSGKLCPNGWHIPSDGEWNTLINFLGGEDVAGGHMKAIGTSHWNAPNQEATNNSGFTALPAGYLFDNGNYNSIGNITHWWTATENGAQEAFDRYVYFQNGKVVKGTYSKQVFYSCRCVKD